MKKLSKKTFITLFTIISSFLIIGIITINVEAYHREYENVKRNLTFVNPTFKNKEKGFDGPEIENMKIIDYQVYTIRLQGSNIERIINHGEDNKLDITNVANQILKTNNVNRLHIGSLYLSKYAYNLRINDSLIILNTKDINNRLTSLLLYSLIIFMLAEIVIYYISKKITTWITAPALESFNKQKDFIADASHELKTPLAIIMASADELKDDKKNSKYVSNIKYETERMNKLITNLLDLSRLESGVTKDAFKEENISKIVNKIALTFEGIAYENKLNIKTDIEDNIVLNCNKDEIEKLISIIIDNAIKHSDKDNDITINMHQVKNNIIIDVINVGVGINPGDEEKIFERFYRADKARNRTDNRYGLGLAIAKNIVINHNGLISASSKENKTTFKIILKK